MDLAARRMEKMGSQKKKDPNLPAVTPVCHLAVIAKRARNFATSCLTLHVYLQQFDTSSLDVFSHDQVHALLRDGWAF